MRRFTHAVVWLATAFLLLGLACGTKDDGGPTGVSGNGGGGGGEGVAYEMYPWHVERHGADLYGVIVNGLAPTVVGERGIAMQVRGLGSYALPTGTTTMLNDVWSFPGGLTFVVGDLTDTEPGLILRYHDGKRYDIRDAVVSGNVTAVDGLHENDVYMTTSAGQVLRYHDGAVEELYSTAPLFDISVTKNETIFASGQDGVYVRSAMNWTRSLDRPGRMFRGVSAATPDSVLAVGSDDIWFYNGGAWIEVHSAKENLHDVDWVDRDWAVAVGQDGITVVFDGDTWTEDDHFPYEELNAVAVTDWGGFQGALAVGASGMTSGTAGAYWSTTASPKTPWADLAGTHSGSDILGILGGQLMRYDGANWLPGPVAGNIALTTLWVIDATHIWAAGKDPGIDNFAGLLSDGTWDMRWLSSMESPRDVWAADLHNAFVASDYGTVFHSSQNWAPNSVIQPVQDLHGIWGVSVGNVFVVGDNGTICRWDGNVWTPMTSGTTAHLNAIHGSDSNNIFAVGDRGTVLRYNGSGWIVLHSGTTYDLTMVWAGSPDNVWAATADGNVVHYNGLTYDVMTTNLPQIQHNAIWGTVGNDVRIGCEDDFLLRYLGG